MDGIKDVYAQIQVGDILGAAQKYSIIAECSFEEAKKIVEKVQKDIRKEQRGRSRHPAGNATCDS